MADLGPKIPSEEKDVVNYIEQVDANEYDGDIDKANLEKGDHASELLASGHVQVTPTELANLEAQLDDMPVDKTKKVLTDIYNVHKHDPRYDPKTLERINMFINDESVTGNPDLYGQLIYEMRIFALLVTVSSAYAEVRAIASDKDDPSLPSLTLRVWVIGTLFSAIGCVINTVFTLRYPSISIGQNVIQLLAYPLGVLWAKFLPDVSLFGIRLNPGPFNRKEHMLITVMSGLGMSWPPTQHLIWAQAMPQFFGQEYARLPGYQFLGALGTNMIGFGFAGITRRFLVYPSYCIWPASLATIALNNALHEAGSVCTPVRGPFRSTWRASMFKCFWVVFGAYFIYYFFPGYMFPNLTIFDWIAWIKPTNGKLVAITSVNFAVGVGFNPFPTLDYNFLSNAGGTVPMFVYWNFFIGVTVGILVAIIFWFKNLFNSGYLMIDSPNTFDSKAKQYKVANIVDKAGRLIPEKYQQYSEPYMSATRCVHMLGTMAYTTAKEERVHFGDDIHYRLMQAYPEVPEWWFVLIVLISMVLSFVCLGVYTEVSPAVVLIAPIITLIFLIPIGIVTSVSGLEPSLNVIAELIGGGLAGGDTMTVQYFRMFGSEPVYHALIYANDLKLSHYVKIAPRHMFCAQIWGALVGTVVAVGQWNWLMDVPGICTPDAPFRLICPAAQGDYSSFIFWGTLGAKRLFGPGGRFTLLLIGFPIGIAFPILIFFLKKRFPRSEILQSTHPLLATLAFAWGGSWGTYVPGMFINYFSWSFLKRKYLEFWTRYNYVIIAALGASISINALITFFALVFPGIAFPTWWGNPDSQPGCIGNWTNAACGLYKIDPARGFFGPEPGNFI
ncbi:hypothetical protein CcaverHIS631_0507990 [Cutaneotrichosporon cavernicola]|nr:hypothetical protein CcaverHIS631_0507990 [Cutaneotrichosporon cavernicola]